MYVFCCRLQPLHSSCPWVRSFPGLVSLWWSRCSHVPHLLIQKPWHLCPAPGWRQRHPVSLWLVLSSWIIPIELMHRFHQGHMIKLCDIDFFFFTLQVQTLTRIFFHLDQQPPPPLMPVIQPWSWMLSPHWEERCSSSRIGTVFAEDSYILMFKLIMSGFLYENTCLCPQLLLAQPPSEPDTSASSHHNLLA